MTVTDTLTVTIQYPGADPLGEEPAEPYSELIPARLLRTGCAVLTAHSAFVPLAPGDVVSIDDAGVVTGVEAVTEDWVLDVFMYTLVADEVAARIFEEWRRAVPLTVTSPITCRLSSGTKQWVDDAVVTKPEVVQFIDVIRRPGQQIDLAAEIARH